jgi:L-amino acid N-acyltransferase YncA
VGSGAAEISIYVEPNSQGGGIGKMLLSKLIVASEDANIWTLQSSIISTNTASIRLHQKCGFRLIGYRERIAKDMDGIWRNIVMLERRSNKGKVMEHAR